MLGLAADDPRAIAERLHDRIRDTIPFGWTPDFWRESPAETRAAGRGFCITKSALLVDELRRHGLDAHMVFAEIDAAVLGGLIDPGTDRVDHAYVELTLGAETLAFDSHVVDLPLFTAAQAELTRKGRQAGLATHRDANARFPGWSQFTPALRGRVWGRFPTAASFYETVPEAHNRLGWLARKFFPYAAAQANDRADALRAQI